PPPRRSPSPWPTSTTTGSAGLPPFCGPVGVRVGSTATDVSSARSRLGGVGPRTRCPELRRRPVAQRAVWPLVVVRPLPLLAQHLRLQRAGELLDVEQLVAHLAVERLAVAVLPRRPRLDVQRLQPRLGHPRPDRPGDELRAVVAADV